MSPNLPELCVMIPLMKGEKLNSCFSHSLKQPIEPAYVRIKGHLEKNDKGVFLLYFVHYMSVRRFLHPCGRVS